MSELIVGKPVAGTFCPSCAEIVFHSPDAYPTEIYCPHEDRLITIPPPLESSTQYTVIKIGARSITFSADGIHPVDIS